MTLRHRIAFLIPKADSFQQEKLAEFHQHWNNAHGELVMPNMNIVGYVQNRPVDTNWHLDQFHGIAELFFEDEAGEDAAWTDKSAPALSEDEHYMFNVEDGFSTLVTDIKEIRPGEVTRTRELSLGGNAENIPVFPKIGAIQELTLETTVPVENGSNKLISVFARGRDEAEKIASVVVGRTVIVDAVQMITQPVIRAHTKMGVKVGVSKPMRWLVGPAG